jgi:hypothetical protein
MSTYIAFTRLDPKVQMFIAEVTKNGPAVLAGVPAGTGVTVENPTYIRDFDTEAPPCPFWHGGARGLRG